MGLTRNLPSRRASLGEKANRGKYLYSLNTAGSHVIEPELRSLDVCSHVVVTRSRLLKLTAEVRPNSARMLQSERVSPRSRQSSLT